MTKRVLAGILIVLVLAVAVMIFLFSAQTAEDSGKASKDATMFFIRLFRPDYKQAPVAEKRLIRRYYNGIVRKLAHGFEFMLLGGLLYVMLRCLRARRCGLIAWAGGTLYACTDELHQTFVDGRTPHFLDVGIDSLGVVLGILLGVALLRLFHRIRPLKTENKNS